MKKKSKKLKLVPAKAPPASGKNLRLMAYLVPAEQAEAFHALAPKGVLYTAYAVDESDVMNVEKVACYFGDAAALFSGGMFQLRVKAAAQAQIAAKASK